MRILFEFKCTKCNHCEDRLVESSVKALDCPNCEGTMARLISPVRCNLEGITGHFPDAADKWARRHEKEGRKPSETHPDGWH